MARLVARLGFTRYEADEYYRIALNLYEKKNLEEAILNINSAIEMYPRRAEYYAVRGYFRLQDGLIDEPAADFEQALTINPYEVLANYGKGVIAFNQEVFDNALQYFITAWAADSTRPDTLYYLALTYHRQRDNVQAKQYMQQAADIYGQSAEDDRDTRKLMKNAEKWIREFDKLIKDAEKRQKAAQATDSSSS
ncbi:MAG: tetratricopeptide repeat protein [Phototrophicaceae bacterium]